MDYERAYEQASKKIGKVLGGLTIRKRISKLVKLTCVVSFSDKGGRFTPKTLLKIPKSRLHFVEDTLNSIYFNSLMQTLLYK